MDVFTFPMRGWVVEWLGLGLHVVPGSACGVLLIAVAARILAERSRRKTLLAITTQAPPGTVVAQERGAGGPLMVIQVGSGHTERDS
ncbi:hypothetical protein ACFWY6_03170 [Streptomyces sp. NPDC059037]|uniref:hypothetical protein n=1 Tax=Streptomyces sp. NPDC059037 TaxID=3346710 RepID=UPI0036B3B27B